MGEQRTGKEGESGSAVEKMSMNLKIMERGSVIKGELPRGCELCGPGRKMVLFVTGMCDSNCFYCPLSEHKKNLDVVYADEMPVNSDEDVLEEVRLIGAKGTGITGGDPLKKPERTVHYIELLKENFGKGHHIHLYTATFNPDYVRMLADAGLDEIRFHPPPETWKNFDRTPMNEKLREILEMPLDIGFEIPALPDMEADMRALIEHIDRMGVRFINLNELEFSETNYRALLGRGYRMGNGTSSAAEWSADIAAKIIEETDTEMSVHLCTAAFKDGVQLRNRLKNRAENVAKPYEMMTEDGTLLKGIICSGDPGRVVEILRNEFDVPEDLFYRDAERSRIEIAPWVIEEIYAELPGDSYIVEEYPTYDRLEVERIPLDYKGDDD